MDKKSGRTPSFYFNLLLERSEELQSYKTGLSDEEFDLLFQKDPFFRKNLLMEFKDVSIILKKLQEAI